MRSAATLCTELNWLVLPVSQSARMSSRPGRVEIGARVRGGGHVGAGVRGRGVVVPPPDPPPAPPPPPAAAPTAARKLAERTSRRPVSEEEEGRPRPTVTRRAITPSRPVTVVAAAAIPLNVQHGAAGRAVPARHELDLVPGAQLGPHLGDGDVVAGAVARSCPRRPSGWCRPRASSRRPGPSVRRRCQTLISERKLPVFSVWRARLMSTVPPTALCGERARLTAT